MKSALLSLAILFLVTSFAPVHSSAQELQFDSIAQKYYYQGIVKIDSAKAGALYEICLQWVARAYNSAKDVIQYKDKAEAKIIVKGTWRAVLPEDYDEHTMIIECKDGRVRYTFTDFISYARSLGKVSLEQRGLFKKTYIKSFYR
jgi:hypothetical protein